MKRSSPGSRRLRALIVLRHREERRDGSPANREENREFRRFSRFLRTYVSKTSANSVRCERSSLRNRTGNQFATTGKQFRLVGRVIQNDGYKLFSLILASFVVNCQSALVWRRFRSTSQAATSLARVGLSGIRRSRHWVARAPSSDSAISSKLPCFGV